MCFFAGTRHSVRHNFDMIIMLMCVNYRIVNTNIGQAANQIQCIHMKPFEISKSVPKNALYRRFVMRYSPSIG